MTTGTLKNLTLLLTVWAAATAAAAAAAIAADLSEPGAANYFYGFGSGGGVGSGIGSGGGGGGGGGGSIGGGFGAAEFGDGGFSEGFPPDPSKFKTPEELKDYLERLQLYYALVGRPRFGKRSSMPGLRRRRLSSWAPAGYKRGLPSAGDQIYGYVVVF